MLDRLIKVGSVSANYNGGKYVIEAIESLLAQTYLPQFIVIVDDGSTDNSVDILKGYIKNRCKDVQFDQNDKFAIYYGNYNGIQVVCFFMKSNRGPAAARNVGLEFLKDKVDVIASLDSDDIYLPEKIEKSVEIMKRFPHIAMVYSDYMCENLTTGESKREYKEPFSCKRLNEECIVSTNSIFPSSIINQIGFFDEHKDMISVEDYHFYLKISSVGLIYHLPEGLFRYRLHGKNLTMATDQQTLGYRWQLCHQRFREWLQERGQNAGK